VPLTGGSLAALSTAVASATGAAAPLEGGPSLTATVSRKGTRVQVRGKVPLTADTGAKAGMWSVTLKGSLATP